MRVGGSDDLHAVLSSDSSESFVAHRPHSRCNSWLTCTAIRSSTVDLTGFRMSKSGKQRIFYTVECDVDMAPKEALPGITVKQVSNGFSIRYKIRFCLFRLFFSITYKRASANSTKWTDRRKPMKVQICEKQQRSKVNTV